MKHTTGFTIIEFMVIAALLFIFVVSVYAMLSTRSDPTKTEHAARDALPGKVNIVCIEGYEYLYIETKLVNVSRAGLAPKFDSTGKPSKCRAEK